MRPFMSIAAAEAGVGPLRHHDLGRLLCIGALISAVATIDPPKNSCGISISGMKLVAWSWLRTTAEISRPMLTAANAVSTTISEHRDVDARATRAAAGRAARSPVSTIAWIAASVNSTIAFDTR